MTGQADNGGRDWVETATAILGALGFNRTRIRWKLRQFDKKLKIWRHRTTQRVDHIRYEHRVCPSCGAIQDRSVKTCSRCGAAMGARSFEVLHRIGLFVPGISLSLVLGIAITLVYGRLIMMSPGSGILSMDGLTLHAQGAFSPRLFADGEWWRAFTALFLHIGLWHLGFNLMGLAVVGPHVEELYGRWTLPFFFLLAGFVANMISGHFNPAGNAGASGALMGLIGMAAGRGHRDGTSQGIAVRNLMLKWTAYTMVFGFFIGADNAAHAGGFVFGGAVGWLVDPGWLKRPQLRPLVLAMAVIGIAGASATAAKTLIAQDRSQAMMGDQVEVEATMGYWIEMCDLYDSGNRGAASDMLERLLEDADPESLEAACASIRKKLEPQHGSP